jgi:predicted phage terminase large subunit-like protein
MPRKSQPAAASPSPLRAPEYDIRLPELHEKQREVLGSPARFKVVVCGRQWGKTVLGAIACIQTAVAGGSAWWVGPTFPIGQLGWDWIVRLAHQIPQTRMIGRPDNKITLVTGGTITLRSAENPDSLRGATLDLVVFDEAALAKPEAWPYLRPTLSVRQGKAMFISTPKGLNWYYDLYQDANERQSWQRWRSPSRDNPHLDPADIEQARQEMSSLLFAQEYEAEFISTGTGMFQQDWIRHYRQTFEGDEAILILGEDAVPLSSCVRFHTVDLAWSLEERADYTVISSWALTPKRHLVLLNVIRGHFEGPDIIPRLRFAYERYGGKLVVERATRQLSIVQEAQRQGLPIDEVRAEKDKVARALPATARMESGQVWFPAKAEWLPDITEELLAFPAGRHDDFVDTLSYAVAEGARQGGFTGLFVV